MQEKRTLVRDGNGIKAAKKDGGNNPAKSSHASYLLVNITCHNLRQVVNYPTRVDVTSAWILDLIFASNSIQNFAVSVENGLSDHCIESFLFPVEAVYTAHRTICIRIKDFSRAQEETVLDFIELHMCNFHGSDVLQM